MSDPFSPSERSAIMARVQSTGSAPEMKVRRAIHRAGFRYRLYRSDLPGKPDLVFPRFKLVVFVHGCFWHWHGCKRSRMPEANRDYWTRKIDRNVERDKRHREALNQLGWDVTVIWECELKPGIDSLIADLNQRRVTIPREA